jgi:hypothetical protein
VPVLPLALWAIIKETPGVQRFQAIQTGPADLKIRLEPKHPEEAGAAWDRVAKRVSEFLTAQSLGNVAVQLAPEPPMRDPKSGKFRNVWAEKTMR